MQMLAILVLWTLPLLSALPTTSRSSLKKRCTNALTNPSFDLGISPWLEMGFGSWSTRGIYTSSSGGHSGPNFYYGHSNASATQSTLSLAQSGFTVPTGATVACAAWVASERPGNAGSTRVEVFLDGVTCGGPVWLGTSGWVRVGGEVKVGEVGGEWHTVAVVVMSDLTGEEGGGVWVDDVIVGVGC